MCRGTCLAKKMHNKKTKKIIPSLKITVLSKDACKKYVFGL